MKLFLLAICVFFGANVSLAGARVGNGGNAVICYEDDNQTIKSVEVLDFYEFQENIELSPDQSLKGKPYQDIVRDVIDRIRKLDYGRANTYDKLYKEMMDPSTFLDQDHVFYEVKDAGHVFLKKGCIVRQIAIQRHERVKYHRQFFINKTYFDMLDDFNKAGLIMHELVFFEAIERGHINSIPARQVNRFFFSDWLPTITAPTQFFAMMHMHGMMGISYFEKLAPGSPYRVWYMYPGDKRKTFADASTACDLQDEKPGTVVAEWNPQLLKTILFSKIGMLLMASPDVAIPIWGKFNGKLGHLYFERELYGIEPTTDMQSPEFLEQFVELDPTTPGGYVCKILIPIEDDFFGGVDQ